MNASPECVSESWKEVSTSLNPLLQRNTCEPLCLIYHLPDSEDRPVQSLWVAADSQLQSASYIWHPRRKQAPIHVLPGRQDRASSKTQETRGQRAFSPNSLMIRCRATQVKLSLLFYLYAAKTLNEPKQYRPLVCLYFDNAIFCYNRTISDLSLLIGKGPDGLWYRIWLY